MSILETTLYSVLNEGELIAAKANNVCNSKVRDLTYEELLIMVNILDTEGLDHLMILLYNRIDE